LSDLRQGKCTAQGIPQWPRPLSGGIPFAVFERQFRDARFIQFAQAEFYHAVVLFFGRDGDWQI
jgi:hypothetical protein